MNKAAEDSIRSLREQLAQELLLEPQRFRIREEEFDLYRVGNTSELLDRLIAQGPEDEALRDERIPYWADLWPSSIGLARLILDSLPPPQPGQQALELGCGMALASLAAGKKGWQPLMSDYLPTALLLAELHWRMNIASAPRTCLLDWRAPDPALAADLILASDVLYEQRNVQPLLRAFETLLRPGGLILLADPGRKACGEFLSTLQELDYQIESTQEEVRYLETNYRIGLYRIRRRDPDGQAAS